MVYNIHCFIFSELQVLFFSSPRSNLNSPTLPQLFLAKQKERMWMRMRTKLKARGTLIRKRRKVGVYVVLVDAEDISSFLVIKNNCVIFPAN